MAAKFRIIMVLVILFSVIGQGQMLYICHTEDTVHLISSCCDEMEVEETCCESERESDDVQINEKCCSKSEVKFTNIITGIENVLSNNQDDRKSAFYLPVTVVSQSTLDKTVPVNLLFNNSPPVSSRQIYVELSSFLC